MRVLIVDDETLARSILSEHLQQLPDVEIVGQAANGFEAVKLAEEINPELVFLDIQMPKLSGFEVLELLGERAPSVIFTTAYDEFALRAFDLSAVDYLLKPVDRERFDRALARVERRLAAGEPAPRTDVGELLHGMRPEQPYVHRFLVRSPRGYYFVRTDDVEWVEAEGNYAALHAGGRRHLVRQTMKTLEARLDPARFVRVHRSAIVDVTRLVRAEPLGHGEYRLQLASGAQVETSRAYSAKVQEILRA